MNELVLVLCWAAVGRAAIIITAGPDPAGHAEVQNMIRDSEQRSWCRPGHIRQIITHDNCHSQELQNQVCGGSCLSYSLPQTEPQNPGADSLNFCESCQPSESHWINVTLSCTLDQVAFEEVKLVQHITNCSCTTCPGFSGSLHTTSHEVDNHEDDLVSDLLDRALPPTEEESRPSRMSPQTTPSSAQLTLTSVTPPGQSSTPQGIRSRPPGDNSVLGDVLRADDSEVVIPPHLQALVNNIAASRDGLGLADLRVEEESDPNGLGDSDHGLESTMRNINELFKGKGSKKLSLNEIKSVLNNLAEPRPAGTLSDKSVYSASVQDQQIPV